MADAKAAWARFCLLDRYGNCASGSRPRTVQIISIPLNTGRITAAATTEPIAQKMNEMAQKYYDTSRPAYCARYGFVDEIVDLKALRGYLKAFAGAVYQNP